MNDQEATNKQVITGILLANQFDPEGNISGLAIYANTEDVFDVVQKTLDQKLLDLLQMKIRVHGEIRELSHGRRGLKVTSFEVVDEDIDDGFFIKNKL